LKFSKKLKNERSFFVQIDGFLLNLYFTTFKEIYILFSSLSHSLSLCLHLSIFFYSFSLNLSLCLFQPLSVRLSLFLLMFSLSLSLSLSLFVLLYFHLPVSWCSFLSLSRSVLSPSVCVRLSLSLLSRSDFYVI
jgi:hypothetical protein